MADKNTPRVAYLAAMAGEEVTLPPPTTRDLKWMAKFLGQDVETEPVQTPEEAYWEKIVEQGGGGGATLVEKTITANGSYDPADDDADGYSGVTVNVPGPSGTVNITTNGTHDVANYASAAVNVPNSYTAEDEGKAVRNGALVEQNELYGITANGNYDTTYWSNVEVNVSSSAEVYTISGTGEDPVEIPSGLRAFIGQTIDGPFASSAVTVRLGGMSLCAGCVGQQNGVEFAIFEDGTMTAYAHFSTTQGLILDQLTYRGQDMSARIPNATWTITVFDNSEA